MSEAYKLSRTIIADMCLRYIPISSIVSEVKQVSIEEGWGGKHIMYFPPYDFFRIYVSGDEKYAKDAMKHWYFNRFVKKKLYMIPKSNGGMLGGSLFKAVSDVHTKEGINVKKDFSNADIELIKKAIDLEVDGRFSLIKSIRNIGYVASGDFIHLKKTGSFYKIIDGHHRVAAMAACSYSTVQGTTINSLLIRLIRRITKSV